MFFSLHPVFGNNECFLFSPFSRRPEIFPVKFQHHASCVAKLKLYFLFCLPYVHSPFFQYTAEQYLAITQHLNPAIIQGSNLEPNAFFFSNIFAQFWLRRFFLSLHRYLLRCKFAPRSG